MNQFHYIETCNLLEEVSYVPSAASRPTDTDRIRFESRRHHMHCGTFLVMTSSFFIVVIHSEAERWFQLVSPLISVQWTCDKYLCPISCVIVCANVMPLSSLTLQLLSGRHMPATWATPSVLHGVFFLAHMSLRVTRIATSWWCGCESFLGFNDICHLQNSFKVMSAFTVVLNSRSSSSSIIRTTTTFTRLPMLGSKYRDDT